MLRRNRHAEPEPAPEHERFDLGELRARRARQEAEAVAGAMESVPPVVAQYLARPLATPSSPLAHYLDDAARPVALSTLLPPIELAATYDDELVRLLEDANRAHGEAAELRDAWQSTEPGGRDFLAALDADDEDELVHAIVVAPAQAFARAYRAHRHALDADDAVRSYALGATTLHDALDARCDELADEIGVLFEKVRDSKDRRTYDDALALAAEWRDAAALYAWCKRPTAGYRPRPANKIPGNVAWRAYEATTALGIAPSVLFDIPLDAPDAPKRSPRGPTSGIIGA